MAGKSSNSNKGKKPVKTAVDRDKRRARTMSYIFLGISVILILSMILSAVAKF
jgi:predicted nucleic acid-binding Zn ribbon protein